MRAEETAMSDQEQIKMAYQRAQKAIMLRPSVGQGTLVTKVRVRGGMTCEIEDGKWKLVADEVEGLGGNDEGPSPGTFGRAALGSCLAIGYAMSAAALGVSFASIEVDVETDFDARGMFDVDDSVSPGWSEIRYVVRVESSASEEAVIRVIDHADKHSSMLDGFARALEIERNVQISAPKK
jgi:uncharacterized OsmC-like protein